MTLVIKLVAAGWFVHNNVIVQPEIVGNVQSKILTEGKGGIGVSLDRGRELRCPYNSTASLACGAQSHIPSSSGPLKTRSRSKFHLKLGECATHGIVHSSLLWTDLLCAM